MDKTELKKVLKPLIKECIREVLMEQGLQKMISEAVEPVQQAAPARLANKKPVTQPTQSEAVKNHKMMLQEIAKSGYVNNGFNPFNGTQALPSSMAPKENSGAVTQSSKLPPAMMNIDPSDPGVDISGVMNLVGNSWKSHMGGKG